MKHLVKMASVVTLATLTKAPFRAELRPNGTPGFFERLADCAPGSRRACACALHVERIEAAVDAIVFRKRSSAPRQTVRIQIPESTPLVRA